MKRGETHVTKSRLGLFLQLTDLVVDASFLDQSQSIIKQNFS